MCLSKLEQAGLPTNQPIEELGSCLAGFDDKISSSMRAEQEATSRSMQTRPEKSSFCYTEESKCPLCVQPLTGEYKTDLIQTDSAGKL